MNSPQNKYIAQCIEEIKEELRQDSMNVKATAIAKLTYVSACWWQSPLNHATLLLRLNPSVANAWLRHQLGSVQHHRSDELDQVHVQADGLLGRVAELSREHRRDDADHEHDQKSEPLAADGEPLTAFRCRT